jgi:hypothetical protein
MRCDQLLFEAPPGFLVQPKAELACILPSYAEPQQICLGSLAAQVDRAGVALEGETGRIEELAGLVEYTTAFGHVLTAPDEIVYLPPERDAWMGGKKRPVQDLIQ